MNFDDVIRAAAAAKASDIHFQEGRLPLLRIGTKLIPWGEELLDNGHMLAWIKQYCDDLSGNMTCSFWHGNQIRCRMHGVREHAGLHAAVRLLYPLEELPPDEDELLLQSLGKLDGGLVLVCGPTGSGKTTALWRILAYINESRPCHILTLEDPMEYVVPGKTALISQREAATHFASFAEAIRDGLRLDPDVLLIGEIRGRETMDAALTAAETGHLVFSTLHTRTAAQAVSRIAGMYGGTEQEEVRSRLAMVLQGILAQRRCVDEEGVHIVREVLLQTPAVSRLIRCSKEFQLETVMQTGGDLGMRTMAQAVQRRLRR